MTTIITRLYAAEDKAFAAVSALKRRFGENEINIVTPTSGNAAEIEAKIAKGGVKPSAAAAYAEKVAQGHSLVTVRAVWGFAKEAIATLDRAGPIDGGNGRGETSKQATGWNEASPFSAWLRLPVLTKFKSYFVLKNDPAAFSTWAKWPVLTDKKPSATLLNDPTPFSNKLGQPTLSRTPPFSSLAKNDKSQRKLISWAAPFSDFCNLPVLLND